MGLVEPLSRKHYGLSARITNFGARRITGKPIDMASIGVSARVPAIVRANTYMESVFVSRRRKTPHRLLELVSLRSAMEVGCSFCIDMGSHMVTAKHGLTAEDLANLPEHGSSARFSDADKAALDLAVAMTATPPVVSEELAARLQSHFSETQLVELMAMIAWENARSRINLAAGLTAQGFSEPGVCAVPAGLAAAPAETDAAPVGIKAVA